MSKKRNIFRKAASAVAIKARIISESLHFLKMQLKYNASVGTYSDKVKLGHSLSRQAHTLEKGGSLRCPREGFGKNKALRLERETGIYCNRYGKDAVVERCREVLETWKNDVESLSVPFDAEKCRQDASGDFDALTRSRHSLRVFAPGPVSREKIEKALEIASRTPSACNRQAWHTDIYEGEMATRLVKWQGGARGFEEEVGTAILVSCDLRGFLEYEVHQAWVDGGMYAMNLINALHYEGLGTIPLSCGFANGKLSALKGFGLNPGFVPVEIIGVGNLTDCKVARSIRKPVEETNVWH